MDDKIWKRVVLRKCKIDTIKIVVYSNYIVLNGSKLFFQKLILYTEVLVFNMHRPNKNYVWFRLHLEKN